MVEGGWHGVGKCIGEIASSADDGVGRGDFRNGKIIGGKFNSFDNALSSVFWDVHSVAPIVFGGTINVPPSDSMG